MQFPNRTSLIPFSNLSVTLDHDGKQYTIMAVKEAGKITISVPNCDLTAVTIPRIRHESEDFNEEYLAEQQHYYRKITPRYKDNKNNALDFISGLPSPFFLGLDRTVTSNEFMDESIEQKKRRYLQDGKVLIQKSGLKSMGLSSGGLAEVQNLISERMHYIRKTSDKEYERQRNNFLISSFKYTGYADIFDNEFNTNMDREVLSRRKEIEHTLGQMRIFDDDAAKKEFNNFFESIQNLIDSRTSNKEDNNWHIEWLVNKTQIERMHKFLKIIDDTKQKIDSVSAKLNRFLEIINGYYKESGKQLYIDPLGQALLKLPGSGRKATLEGLSSGEKQILIIFGNSILRKGKDNVFIIDEPELSLHLQWQERLIDDIGSLNTGAQFVFATHSPEIIAGNEDKCKEVTQ